MTITVEFGLPTGAGGMAAAHSSANVRKHLKAFEQQTNCTIKTHVMHHDYRHWLVAEIPQTHYTLFQIYWTEKMSFMAPVKVSP